jgi:HK97 family phage major capsid protein
VPIHRTDAGGGTDGLNMIKTIDQDLQRDIVANVYEDSALLQLANVIQMSSAAMEIVTGTSDITVPSTGGAAGQGAYNVAEGEAKPESTGGVTSYTITANKMATFMIVSDELLSETAVDLITYFQDTLTQKMAFAIDKYGLLGGGPFGNEAVGNATTITQSEELGAGGATIFSNQVITGDDFTNAFNLIEANDYVPNGWVMQRALKGSLRLLKTASGSNEPLLAENMQVDIPDAIWGEPAYFLGRGVFPTSAADSLRGVVGDFSQYTIGIRDELSFSLHTEGTVNSVNLLETNQVALRAEMRLGAKVVSPLAFCRIVNAPAT